MVLTHKRVKTFLKSPLSAIRKQTHFVTPFVLGLRKSTAQLCFELILMGFVSRSIVLGQDFHGSTGWSFKNSPFEMKDNPNRFFKTEDIIESRNHSALFFINLFATAPY